MYKITHFKEVNMISSKVNLSLNKLLVKNKSTKIQQNHCNQTKNNICQIEGSTVAYVLFDILNIRIKDRKSVDDACSFILRYDFDLCHVKNIKVLLNMFKYIESTVTCTESIVALYQ